MIAKEDVRTTSPNEKDLGTTTLRSQDATPTSSSIDEERVANDLESDGQHIFSDPKVAEYWRGVYEKAQYECRHRFNPSATWTPEEELKLRRRVSEHSCNLKLPS